MLKHKRILFIFILAIALFLIPNICHAANTYTGTSKTSTDKTVNWSYELDNSNNAVNLICTNVSGITGTVDIPSTIGGHTVVVLGKQNYATGTFEGCTGLTGVTIPDTVTIIGYNAFKGCTGLKSIKIPNSVTIVDYYSFQGCTGLKSVTFGNSVTKIGANAFNGCTGLTSLTIPQSVTTIESYAFSKCSGITSITLSKNITAINNGTFGQCSALKEVIIPDSVTTISGDTTYSYRCVL